jgi:hypothetical protein
VAEALGLTASVIAPASGNLNSASPTFVLPITGGDTTTEIDYGGGVLVNAGPFGSYSVTDFVAHLSGPQANILTGEITGTDEPGINLPLADFNSAGQFILDPEAAAFALEGTGINGDGLVIATGVTQIETAAAAPEPTELGLVGLGLLGLALGTRRKKK